MPTEQEKKLKEESDQQEKNSVFDFLYHDVYRISSFLSQFDTFGYLQSSTNSSSVRQERHASSEESITGKLPPIAEGQSTKSYSDNEASANGLSKTYNPLWQNSLSLLDYLQQKKLINKETKDFHIGKFVLVSGNLLMFDIDFMKRLMKESSIKQSFTQGIIQASNRKTADIVKDILNVIPGSIQARLINEDFCTWSTLRPDGLNLSTDDLLLKHGASIEGVWNILGILDAMPDDEEEKDYPSLPSLQKSMQQFSKIIRPEFGRPTDYFGITPLMIFREVSGK